MPVLRRFKIKNFRGIQSTDINIDVRKKSNVITLIGLNESGKTTILEALSHFSTGDRDIPNLLAQSDAQSHLLSLMPIEKRPAFTDTVSIRAEIGVTKAEMRRYYDSVERDLDVKINDLSHNEVITVTREFRFVDSVFSKQINIWSGIEFEYKGKGDKKFKTPKTLSLDSKWDKIWHNTVAKIQEDLFDLVYFPTFIVDFPQGYT